MKCRVTVGARIGAGGDKLQIHVISPPRFQSVAFEVIQSLRTFHKAGRST